MSNERRRGSERAARGDRRPSLARLLYEWDFLGVYEDPEHRPADDDEYSDLVGPLHRFLEEGQDAPSIASSLAHVIERDYEVEVDCGAFAERAREWWMRDAG